VTVTNALYFFDEDSSKKYANELVRKFGLSDAKPHAAPLSMSTKLYRGEGSALSSEPYAELVGGLTYLATCTKSDLALSVGILAKYMSNPTSVPWKAANSILQYIASTVDHGIRFFSWERCICGKLLQCRLCW